MWSLFQWLDIDTINIWQTGVEQTLIRNFSILSDKIEWDTNRSI